MLMSILLCLVTPLALLGCGQSTEREHKIGNIVDFSSAFKAIEPLVTLAFVGDVNLGDGVAPYISSYGVDYTWANVREVLQSVDLAFANLECALSSGGSAVPGKSFCFRGTPDSAQGLVNAGIDVVSLANNHSKDYGVSALRDTFSILGNQSIRYCGAGENSAWAYQPSVLEVRGKKVAFVAFSDILPYDWPATAERPGVASTRDRNKVAETVRAADREADYVVASFHWGIELATAPNGTQKELAHLAVDAGADVVVGHHPHVVQGFEFYNGRLIAYSLGNFIFSPPREISAKTLLLEICLGPQGVIQAKVIPARISGCRPVIMGTEEGNSWLSTVRGYCSGLDTDLTIVAGRGYILPRGGTVQESNEAQ